MGWDGMGWDLARVFWLDNYDRQGKACRVVPVYIHVHDHVHVQRKLQRVVCSAVLFAVLFAVLCSALLV